MGFRRPRHLPGSPRLQTTPAAMEVVSITRERQHFLSGQEGEAAEASAEELVELSRRSFFPKAVRLPSSVAEGCTL